MNPPSTVRVLLLTLIALLLLPTLVFVGAALTHGMGLELTLAALAEQYVAGRSNLLVVTLLGCFPLLLIVALLGVRRLVRKTWQGGTEYAIGGAIPIVLVCLFVNLEYWPSYLPAQQFLGFPHGLEFVIGPLFIAPAGAFAGFVVAWVVRRRAA